MLRPPHFLGIRRYNTCMGREEAFLYKDLDFLTEEFTGPLSQTSHTDLARSIYNLNYFSHISLVPYCYVKIYRLRRTRVVPGSGESQERLQESRRQRNVVTFSYNMTIWLAETSAALILVNLLLT